MVLRYGRIIKNYYCYQFKYYQALLRAINNSGGREDIIEAAVCALRHITSRHPSAEMAQNSVRQQNGIPMLCNFMQQQCRWPLLKALLGEFVD